MKLKARLGIDSTTVGLAKNGCTFVRLLYGVADGLQGENVKMIRAIKPPVVS